LRSAPSSATPATRRALFQAGLASEGLNAPDRAIGFYQKALALQPANVEAQRALIRVLQHRSFKPGNSR
jgi:hypothetical protein